MAVADRTPVRWWMVATAAAIGSITAVCDAQPAQPADTTTATPAVSSERNALASRSQAKPVSPPPAYVEEERYSPVFAAYGGTMLLFGYGLAVVFGTVFVAAESGKGKGVDADPAAADADGLGAGDFAPIYIPVVGPFITVATIDAEGGDARLLVANGIIQSVGATVLVVGLFFPEKVRIPAKQTAKPGVMVSPTLGAKQVGMNLRWVFE